MKFAFCKSFGRFVKFYLLSFISFKHVHCMNSKCSFFFKYFLNTNAFLFLIFLLIRGFPCLDNFSSRIFPIIIDILLQPSSFSLVTLWMQSIIVYIIHIIVHGISFEVCTHMLHTQGEGISQIFLGRLLKSFFLLGVYRWYFLHIYAS